MAKFAPRYAGMMPLGNIGDDGSAIAMANDAGIYLWLYMVMAYAVMALYSYGLYSYGPIQSWSDGSAIAMANDAGIYLWPI